MRIAVAIVVSALVAARSDRAPQLPVFRAGVDVLTMETSVIDRDGKPVSDLRVEDFAVTIDGKPRRVRAVRSYNNGDVDGAPVVVSAGVPGPLTNSADDGRIVVFVVDRDSIVPGSERGVLDAASTILDSLGSSDASGVLELPGVSTELTRDHARVRAALMRLTGARPVTLPLRDRDISWDEALGFERRDDRTVATVIERECPDCHAAGGNADMSRRASRASDRNAADRSGANSRPCCQICPRWPGSLRPFAVRNRSSCFRAGFRSGRICFHTSSNLRGRRRTPR